jgi:phytoene dehydrogenase-like protein
MKYDAIIIGAGLSGLAAGIRLAYYEKRVVVLERHTTVGGLNSFYRLRGRNYDVGLHAVTNYAAPGTRTGPLAKLLKQLRLRWDDFGLVPQNGSTVVFPGHALRFENDLEAFTAEVAREFPDRIDGFRTLLRRIAEHDPLALDRREVSARAVVAGCLGEGESARLLADMLFCPVMFYGSPTPRDMDWNQFVIMFRALYEEGFGRPPGGVRPIMKAVTRQYRALGGELRLRAGVQRIRHLNGRAIGVTLDDGTELDAENVVSSAGSFETAKLLADGSHRRDDYEHGAISFVETIFPLAVQPRELGHDDTIVFYNDRPEFAYDRPDDPCDLRSGIVCSPNNFQYGDGDDGEGMIRITALANPAYWMDLPDDDYAAAKTEWTDRIVESALRFVPDFRPHVRDVDTFTPRTIRRFTGHADGAVYGSPRKIVSGSTHLEHLYLCGTDQGFLGIVGALLSGITIANAHLLR